MTQARMLLIVSLLGISVAAVMFHGCGKADATSSKFTIVGAGE